MTKVGYARVSSRDQNFAIQLEKLTECSKIFEEKMSALTDQRPRLKACLEYVREGDTLVVTRLDRLARSTLDLCQIAKTLEDKHVNLLVIDQNIDTSHATGRLLFHMLASIAQFETELRAERQQEGIAKAKQRGVRFGRSKALNQQQIHDLRQKRQDGILITELMKEYRLGKTALYRYLKPLQEPDPLSYSTLTPIHHLTQPQISLR